MPRYVRLVYASRATFPPIREGAGIHPEVARILVQSRRNNSRQRLVGGLYFADGSFFQCLEGREADVDALYERLAQDPRHREVRLLDRRVIDAPAFGDWAMKHVPNAPEVQQLLARHGRSGFEPHSFPPPLVDAMVKLLLQRPDVAPPGETDATALQASARRMLVARIAVATGLAAAVGAAAASWLR
ncbi:MAG TPA: BLUF domain-containing protein [Arenimonas sp.]|nr:BLUF domain-containing protein [Arenimonas sp.]